MQLPEWLGGTVSQGRIKSSPVPRHQTSALLTKALKGLEGFLIETLAADSTAKRSGLWQALDPRVKVVTAVGLICLLTFQHHPLTLVVSYGFTLAFATASRIALPSFLGRTWGFALLFAGVVVLPLTLNWVTPGKPVLVLLQSGADLAFYQVSSPLTVTAEGLQRAATIILRTVTATSLALLLTLTTPWTSLLKALRALCVPRLVVLILETTLRYVFLLVKVAVETLEARALRMVGPLNREEKRAFFAAILGTIVSKSYSLNEAVYEAMHARGYSGEPRILNNFRLRTFDFAWIITNIFIAAALLYADRLLL
ncbi:MAG: cobalt ECF transporter T component CbiQ [Bacillota bacterium]